MAKVAVVEIARVNYWPHVHPAPLFSSFRLWGLCGYRGVLLGFLPSCQGLKTLSYLSPRTYGFFFDGVQETTLSFFHWEDLQSLLLMRQGWNGSSVGKELAVQHGDPSLIL